MFGMNNYITGAAIRALREKNRLTQQQLAEKLCVSDKAISKWETGVSHIHSLIASSMLCISLYPRFLTEQAGKQRYKGHADKGNAAARHKLFYPQIGVKPCSMAGGGVSKNIWNCFRTAPEGTGQPLTWSTSGMGLRLK